MPTFTYTFVVNAPLTAVAAFHHDTRILKKLTPPPIFVQIHRYEPLGDGSEAEFTLWFGPLPVRWLAVHLEVGEHGFTAHGSPPIHRQPPRRPTILPPQQKGQQR